MAQSNFINAAFGRKHEHIPIWIMRQAGRYLPEYQAVRKTASFLDICRSPELIAEVTSQPIEIFGFDAAIVFSDILLPLEPLGLTVDFTDHGPRLSPPITLPEDIDKLQRYDPASVMSYVLDGIRATKKRLGPQVPLLGFCGSPLTLAYYAIEGGSGGNGSAFKRFIYQYPEATDRLLSLLAEVTGEYLKAQISAGADAIQLFDSRGGILTIEDYQRYSLKSSRRVFEICRADGVPCIFYLENCVPYLKSLAALDCEVVSIDWRTDIPQAMKTLPGKTVQGNLDPFLTLTSPEILRERTMRLLDSVGGKDNFIFNLGGGILPQTPVENVHLLVELVHEYQH